MKNKFTLLLILALSCLAPQLSFAEDAVTVTFTDGSQLKGELVGINNGKYTLQTSTMGMISVDKAKVASISNQAVAPQRNAAYANPPSGEQTKEEFNQKVNDTQAKLMNDPEAMKKVMALTQDPEMMKLLSDPEITQAAVNRDANSIANNPKAQQLMANPKVKELMESLQK